MKKILALGLFLFCGQAVAQSTLPALQDQINAIIKPNGVGAITAANLNPLLQNMAQSSVLRLNNLNDLGNIATARGNLGLTYFATGTNAANLTGTAPTSSLGSGTADSSLFLRGDRVWANSITNAGPTWASYSNIWNGLTSNVGSYPTNQMFGNDTVGIAQALTGAIAIPASSAAGNHAAGVAGYANTLSTSQGSVGVFGFGGIGVNGGSGWGFNTVTTNGMSPQPASNTGFDGGAIYAWEADFNIVRKAGAVEPNVPIRGIYMIGASETAGVSPIVRAIEIDGLNGFGTKIPWLDVFYVADGAGVRAVNIGSLNVNTGATTSGSQTISFSSFLAGALKAATIATDPYGNIILTPQAGSGVSSSGAYSMTGAVVADNATWTSYASTVQPAAGTITTLGTVTSKYKTLGKTTYLNLSIAITTNGTGSTALLASIPNASTGAFSCTGFESTAYGGIMQVRGPSGAGSLTIVKYDNTYPGADGATIVISCVYENT